MGRRKKYFSEEERKFANNEKVKQFYWRNKEKLDNKAKVYYWKRKILKALVIGNTEEVEKIKQIAIKKGIEEQLLVAIEEILNENIK